MYFLKEVVHEVAFRPHFNRWIKQARWAYQLLHNHTACFLKLILGRCRRHIDCLRRELFKLIQSQRAIVKRSRQTECILNQILLATAVTAPHGLNLRYRLMALIYDKQVIFRKKIKKAIRALSRFSAIKIARVVLYARTMPRLANPFKIIIDPHLNLLRPVFFSTFHIVVYTLLQVMLNHTYSALLLFLAGHEEIGWVNLILIKRSYRIQCLDVQFLYLIYCIIKIRDAQNFLLISKVYVDSFALDTKLPALQFAWFRQIIVDIEHVNQFAPQRLLRQFLIYRYVKYALGITRRCSHSINARHRRYYYDILAS